METIIIVAILVACLGFAVYRIFLKPQCTCGCCGKKTTFDQSELNPDDDEGEKAQDKL